MKGETVKMDFYIVVYQLLGFYNYVRKLLHDFLTCRGDNKERLFGEGSRTVANEFQRNDFYQEPKGDIPSELPI